MNTLPEIPIWKVLYLVVHELWSLIHFSQIEFSELVTQILQSANKIWVKFLVNKVIKKNTINKIVTKIGLWVECTITNFNLKGTLICNTHIILKITEKTYLRQWNFESYKRCLWNLTTTRWILLPTVKIKCKKISTDGATTLKFLLHFYEKWLTATSVKSSLSISIYRLSIHFLKQMFQEWWPCERKYHKKINW